MFFPLILPLHRFFLGIHLRLLLLSLASVFLSAPTPILPYIYNRNTLCNMMNALLSLPLSISPSIRSGAGLGQSLLYIYITLLSRIPSPACFFLIGFLSLSPLHHIRFVNNNHTIYYTHTIITQSSYTSSPFNLDRWLG